MGKYFLNVFFFVFILFSFSCQNEETQDYKQENNNFVDRKTIYELVSQLTFTSDDGNGLKSSKQKRVENMEPVTGSDGLASCYIVNYEDDGFLIMAADNRMMPVLAYSNTGNFETTDDELPPGVALWLEETAAYVSEVRKSDKEQTGNVVDAWNPVSIQRIIGGGGNDEFEPDWWGNCPQDEIVSPLLTTNWHQGEGFNELMQYAGCSITNNGKYPAGCVAIAMAQTMRYHRYPATYFWNLMSNNEGSNEASRLVATAGISVGMGYSCDGSGAKSENIPNSLKNSFGYSSANYGDFNVDRVITDLNQGRPVILSGARKEYAVGIPYRGKGHAWVCDGYRRSYYCEYNLAGNFNGNYTVTTYLHMNWGWGNSSYNTWYIYGDWSSKDGEFNYNYDKKMVYNIKP